MSIHRTQVSAASDPKEGNTVDLDTGDVHLAALKSNGGMYGEDFSTREAVDKKVTDRTLQDIVGFFKLREDISIHPDSDFVFVPGNKSSPGFTDSPTISRDISIALGLTCNKYRKYVASTDTVSAGDTARGVVDRVRATAASQGHSLEVHRRNYMRNADPSWVEQAQRDRAAVSLPVQSSERMDALSLVVSRARKRAREELEEKEGS